MGLSDQQKEGFASKSTVRPRKGRVARFELGHDYFVV